MKKVSTYPDILANLFSSVKAWRFVALLLAFLLLAQGFMMIKIASDRTVILVPQGLQAGKNGVPMNLGDPYTPEYLTALAKGDAYSLLSWTPQTIEDQYSIFLGRLTPTLSSERKQALLTESKAHKDEGLTQSFHTSRSFVAGQAVTLHGILVRSMGGKEVFRGPAAYTFSYVKGSTGALDLAGVSQPSDEEYRDIERQAAAAAAKAARPVKK